MVKIKKSINIKVAQNDVIEIEANEVEAYVKDKIIVCPDCKHENVIRNFDENKKTYFCISCGQELKV